MGRNNMEGATKNATGKGRGRIGNQDRVMGKERLGWSKEEGTVEEACSRERATRNTARLAPAKITYI